jgi:hypothetical protein
LAALRNRVSLPQTTQIGADVSGGPPQSGDGLPRRVFAPAARRYGAIWANLRHLR